MPNQVTRRIFDFLKDIPPFVYVNDEEALMRVAGRVEVMFLPPGTVVFRSGEPPGDRFYVVKEGTVELFRPTDDGEQLVERCGEGDAFGIRPLLAEENHLFQARAAEESLLYAINSEGFRELLHNFPGLTQYLATSMAGSSRMVMSTTMPVPKAVPLAFGLLESQKIDRLREPVICLGNARIVDAARLMTEHNVGSIVVVDRARYPIGIITDRDLRQKVATGLKSHQEMVATIMGKPVICINKSMTAADVQIMMVRKGVNHLVQTEDGTNQSPVTGVVSKHDLLVLQGNNPAVLIREIGRAKTALYLRTLRERAERMLATYLEQEVSISFITTIMTQLNDEIIRTCIKLGLARMQADGRGNPPALFDWLALGSQGRGEQLLRTDQDNALIFEDVPEARYNAVKDYFLQLAGYVTELLNSVGFQYCSADMMASNPRWCLPVSKWKEQFSHWMAENTAENLLNTSIFFDFRGVWGDGSLPAKLTAHIFEDLAGGRRRFFASLAQAALDNPSPLTFFRNFVVERSGEHKDQFDLKSRAMRPLTDAARVLTLQARVGNINNTFQRYEALAELEPQNADLFRDAAQAYEVLIRLRATMGLRRNDSGRFLKPSELSNMQRLLLRNSFTPVREVQSLLSLRFQLKFL
jgi:CBS domain-containing protein